MNQDFKLPDGKLVRRVIAEQMGVKHDLLMQTRKQISQPIGETRKNPRVYNRR